MPHIRVPPNHGLSDIIAGYFDTGYKGWAVDVGASDGTTVNSTYGLETVRGWTVLNVEPNPEFRDWLTENRRLVEKCACADFIGRVPPKGLAMYSDWKQIEVDVTTVEVLLAKHKFPKLDLLCVDTEGTELDVLKGVDLEKWKPKVIVTECWELEGPIDEYLATRGYQKISRIQPETVNDLFYLP